MPKTEKRAQYYLKALNPPPIEVKGNDCFLPSRQTSQKAWRRHLINTKELKCLLKWRKYTFMELCPTIGDICMPNHVAFHPVTAKEKFDGYQWNFKSQWNGCITPMGTRCKGTGWSSCCTLEGDTGSFLLHHGILLWLTHLNKPTDGNALLDSQIWASFNGHKTQKTYPGLGFNSGYFAHLPERKGELTQEKGWTVKIVWNFRLLRCYRDRDQTKKSRLSEVRVWPFTFNKQQSNVKYSLQNLPLALLYQGCLEDLLCRDHPEEQTQSKVINNHFVTQAEGLIYADCFLPAFVTIPSFYPKAFSSVLSVLLHKVLVQISFLVCLPISHTLYSNHANKFLASFWEES